MPSLKFLIVIAILTLYFCLSESAAQVSPRPDDPCLGRGSNAEEGQCYAREQTRVNAEADDLVRHITARYLKDAGAPEWRGVNAKLLKRSAATLTRSQDEWRAYRDRYCRAVEYSWGAGSGAGGAYQACMFEVGKARTEQLRSDFAEQATHTTQEQQP
jgi:uncharacterized protein YecT (DUF1311 family)